MTEWLQQNYDNVLGVVGALYVLARAIVVLTPTPNDDEGLKKVSMLLKTIAKTIGLDLKQGYTPAKKD